MRTSTNTVNINTPIVAIAGGEGSINAMLEWMHFLPAKTGMSYLFIYTGESDASLKELFSKRSQVVVSEAAADDILQPDHLYIISAKKPMMLVDHMFQPMMNFQESHFATMPINMFFNLLAEHYKESVIGVLLSGKDADGTLGLKSIKINGGITLVQNDSAEYNSMPKSAIAEGVADLALSPEDLANELIRIGAQKDVYFSAIQELNENAISNADGDLAAILHILNRSIGVDFSQYKMNTIKRRIIRRMMLFKLQSLKDYTQYIKQNVNEVNKLYQDLLINVTSFFRDPETLEYVRNSLLPKVIKSKMPNDPIRLWVPACSTGQEAYTYAMLIIEALGEKSASFPVQIFATDLSETAITKARLGVYTKDDVLGISESRLERFFTKVDGHFRIVKSIRDMCIFATHNISKDPPFSRLDIISCCNLLIYIDVTLQKKIIATFHYSLQNNGYLILGKSETIGTSAYLFSQIEKRYKVYAKKKDASAKAVFEMNYRLPEPERVFGMGKKRITNSSKPYEIDLDRMVDQMILKSFTPACVVVNQDLDILQFRGSTGLYLEPTPGRASLNLMKMARQSLGFELRNIVHKAQKTNTRSRKEGLEIKIDDKLQRISIEAIPMNVEVESEEEYFMVVFQQAVSVEWLEEEGAAEDKRVKLMEAELSALRDDMRSIIEAQEAANEELQSANEEIVSSNEELQSINEELETSKEEIESSNEELITINQELQMRNEQLAEVQEYSEAVFNMIRESIIILDKDLRVKSANSAFYKTFKVFEEETEGRYIYELGNGQWNIAKLKELLHEIIPANTQFFGFNVSNHFPGIGEKFLTLNARKLVQRTHGQEVILLAIEDVTQHIIAKKVLEEQELWMRHMADNVPAMIWICDQHKQISFCNKSWLEYRGLAKEEAFQKEWLFGIHPDDFEKESEKFEISFSKKQPFVMQYRVKRADGEYFWLLTHAKPFYSNDGHFDGYIGSCIELLDQASGKLE